MQKGDQFQRKNRKKENEVFPLNGLKKINSTIKSNEEILFQNGEGLSLLLRSIE